MFSSFSCKSGHVHVRVLFSYKTAVPGGTEAIGIGILNLEVRLAAVEALGRLVVKRLRAFDTIVKCLEDAEPKVRAAAEDALGKIAGATHPAVLGKIVAFTEDVANRLDDPNGWVRQDMLRVIRRLGVHAARFTRRIAERLGDHDEHVRRGALDALLGLGAPRGAMEGLLRRFGTLALVTAFMKEIAKNLTDRSSHVRSDMLRMMGRLGAPHAVPFAGMIAERLKDRDNYVHYSAQEVLAGLAGHAEPFAGEIAKRLEDEDADVREAAVKAIAALSGHAVRYGVGEIVARLKHRDYRVRMSCSAGFDQSWQGTCGAF